MDRNEKLAVARKKLRRFQSRNSQRTVSQRLDNSTSSLPVTPHSMTPDSDSPQLTNTRLSAADGLREISQEISSILSENALEAGTSNSLPSSTLPPVLNHTPSPHHVHGFTHHSPALTTHPILNREPSSLAKQLQAHRQTIDVLVGEKTALQSELSSAQTQLVNKSREYSDMVAHLSATRQKMEEIEREKFNMAEELARKEKVLSQCEHENGDLRESVERLRGALEEQREENTELVSKVTAQAAELHTLQNSCTDLQSRLNMAELLTQQLSGGAPPSPSSSSSSTSQLAELQGKLEKAQGSLQRMTTERDQALSDLAALRDSLVQQQEDSARRLAELQARLADGEVQVASLSQELAAIQQERDSLMERLSNEHAQFQQSNQVAMETLQRERDELQRRLKQQVQDNAQLTRLNAVQEERVCELEAELSRVSEETVDQQSLLTTIAQDKETISRAVSQNKELKLNLAELQDAFVRLSQQNMELASELETERHRVGELQRLVKETSSMKEEEKEKEEEKKEKEKGEEGEEEEKKEEEESVKPTLTARDDEDRIGNEERIESEHLQALVMERDSLLEQLQKLQSDHLELVHEHEEMLQQMEETSSGKEEHEEEKDFVGVEVDVHNMSPEELVTLQNNFNSLQQRFIALMAEKADLLDHLQENEHVIMQLSGETETIGEYIALYQMQREALRVKFHEKDQFIQEIIAEKTIIQAKLQELQTLMKQLLEERLQPPSSITRPYPPSHTPPPHTSTIPFHLRPQAYGSSPISHSLTETALEQEGVTDMDSHITTGTAEQIMHLLDQLEAHGGVAMETMVPCTCCTGKLVTV